jgi:indole-3-glycerol phosphate synthase
MAMMAGVLRDGGCIALSVLTEPYFFGGTCKDIARVKSAVSLPVLRKDFIIDERQIAESRALGADAVLLISAILKKRLPYFVDMVLDYGLEPLVEVRSAAEAELALSTKADLIGINNRDLSTLGIDRSTTKNLSGRVRYDRGWLSRRAGCGPLMISGR